MANVILGFQLIEGENRYFYFAGNLYTDQGEVCEYVTVVGLDYFESLSATISLEQSIQFDVNSIDCQLYFHDNVISNNDQKGTTIRFSVVETISYKVPNDLNNFDGINLTLECSLKTSYYNSNPNGISIDVSSTVEIDIDQSYNGYGFDKVRDSGYDFSKQFVSLDPIGLLALDSDTLGLDISSGKNPYPLHGFQSIRHDLVLDVKERSI